MNDVKKFLLRLPEELYEAISKEAGFGVSVNTVITQTLQEKYQPKGFTHPSRSNYEVDKNPPKNIPLETSRTDVEPRKQLARFTKLVDRPELMETRQAPVEWNEPTFNIDEL